MCRMHATCCMCLQPNLSQHLSILRKAGIVDFQEDGKRRCYFLCDQNQSRSCLLRWTLFSRNRAALRPQGRQTGEPNRTKPSGHGGNSFHSMRGRSFFLFPQPSKAGLQYILRTPEFPKKTELNDMRVSYSRRTAHCCLPAG